MEIQDIEYAPLPISLDEQVKDLSSWAEPRHSEKAEFHHFPHSQGVYEVSMKLADHYEALGYKINRRALAFGAIGHDIYVHLSLEEFQPITGMTFESKEHRSAWLTRDHLLQVGFDEKTVAQPAYDIIVTTKWDEPVTTIEGLIIRIADIFNTSEEFEVFEERSWAYYREICYFENKTCSFEEWLPGAMNYLTGFIHEDMPDEFIASVKNNIDQILKKYPTSPPAA